MIHFTADFHFGCDKLIANTRPEFSDIEQHDDHLIDMVNTYVDRSDTLVIVGDFCKDKPGKYRQKIRCKHIQFILGNHDKEAKIRAVFGGDVWQQRIVKVGDERVWCSHYPACYWDRSHYGVAHAYGHLHWNREREAKMNEAFPQRRSMDVGVDAAKAILGAYKPWSGPMFFSMLSNKVGHDIIRKEDRWTNRDY